MNARMDFVLFTDGSTYGPDRSKTQEMYQTILETTKLNYYNLLQMLESQGSEKTKAFLRQKLAESDYLKYGPGLSQKKLSNKNQK